MKKRIVNFACRSYFKFFSLFHPIEKKVVFSSFFGKQYSDNPRAISEKLHDKYPEYEIVWILDKQRVSLDCVPDYVRVVGKNEKGHLEIKEIATSFCYVYNCELKPNIAKRKGQLFIQTWHGDLGFKKILYANDLSPLKEKILDEKLTDLCISGSDYSIRMYREAFRYKGEILKVGTPRNDQLVNPDLNRSIIIREKLGISLTDKVLIYAPTFRDNIKGEQSVPIDLHKVLEVLNNSTHENWICLVRSHLAASALELNYDNKLIINASSYFDMADLLSIADLLITDYSSCAGDIIRKNTGAILAAFDKKEYESTCRESWIDFENVGFITAHNQSELEKILQNTTQEEYEKNCKKICRYFNVVESGKAAETICDRIELAYNNAR